MQDSTTFGRALSPVELSHSRYLDALIAFRPESCLSMTTGAPEGGAGGDGGGAGGTGGGQGGSGGSGSGGQGGSQGGSDKGFPAETPVSEMTPVQQAAYFKDKAQKHEDRNKALLQITGGKHGDELKAVFDEYGQLKTASQTDTEKALEQAGKTARAEAALDAVRSSFDLLLPDDMPDEKKTEAIEVLNLAAFLTPDGKVDTAKVRTHAATLAPAKDNGQQRQRDWGSGNRETGGGPAGAAGKAEAERRFPQKSTSTSS